MGKKLLTAISFVSAALLLTSCAPNLPSEQDLTALDVRACSEWEAVFKNPDSGSFHDRMDSVSELTGFGGRVLEPVEGSAAELISAYAAELKISSSPRGSTLLGKTESNSRNKPEVERFKAVLFSMHSDVIQICANVGMVIYAANYLIADPVSEVVVEATDKGTCLENMRIASTISNNDDAERYLKLTAETCGGAAEWYAALRKYPAAMGYYDVQGTELNTVCFVYPNTRACNNP